MNTVKYDISFLKNYLLFNNVNIRAFAENVGIYYTSLYKSLNGKRPIVKNTLDKILHFFNLSSYDELREKVDYELSNNIKTSYDFKTKSKTEKFVEHDLRFLKEYLRYSGISHSYLCKMTNISLKTLNDYLNKECTKSLGNINKILKFFDVETYEELKEKIKTELPKKEEIYEKSKRHNISTYRKVVGAIYDIGFLKEYFEKFNINLTDFSKKINVDVATVSKYFNSKKKLSIGKLKVFLNVFNCRDYEELKNKIQKSMVDNRKININFENKDREEEKYDITFMSKYFELKEIKIDPFCNIIGISKYTLIMLINGKKLADKLILDKILEYFNVSDYEKLKEKINDIYNNLKDGEFESKKYDVGFIKEYLNYKGVKQSVLANEFNLSISTVNNYINSKKLANRKFVKKLLNYYDEDTYTSLKENIQLELNKYDGNIIDYAAISLIFDKKSDISKRIDKLSRILNIDRELLIEKYKYYLNMYKDILTKNYELEDSVNYCLKK